MKVQVYIKPTVSFLLQTIPLVNFMDTLLRPKILKILDVKV